MDDNLNEQLQRYIEGLLSEDEQKKLEARIANDEEVRQEYELLKDMEDILFDEAMTSFRDELDVIHESTTSRKVKLFSIRNFSIAASIMLLIGSVFLINNAIENTEIRESIMAEYSIAYPAEGVTRGGDELARGVLDEYKLRDYTGAIEKLRKYLSQNPSDNQMRFYLGVAYFLNEDYAPASAIFGQLKSVLSESNKANYYLGLIALKEKSMKEAEAYFKSIDNINPLLFKKAEEILAKLGK